MRHLRYFESKEGCSCRHPANYSFFDLATRYDALSHNGDPLESLASHVPWAEFRPALERVLRRSKRKQGGGLPLMPC